MAATTDSEPAVWLDRRTPPHIVTLVMLAGLSALSMNIFLPSLPSIAAYYEADYATVQLAVSAYLAATALVQIVIGPLSDRYGRRPVLLVGGAVFMAATIGCMLAPSIELFLLFRLAQTAIATGFALARAIVRDIAGPARSASMIGYVTMGMALVPMVGPMIGGALDAAFGWQASFLALFIFGALVLALVYVDLGETNRATSADFAEQFRAYPALIRSRRFWGFAAMAAFASGAFFAFLGGAPYVGTELLGMDAATLGLYFGFIAGGYMLGNFLSGRFATRFGVVAMMLAGGAMATFGMVAALALFAAGLAHPLSLFLPVGVVGIGNGIALPSANAGLLSVRPHLAGSASGLGGALMIGGGAALAALAGALLGPGAGAWPLLIIMFVSSLLSVIAALYVRRIERIAGPVTS